MLPQKIHLTKVELPAYTLRLGQARIEEKNVRVPFYFEASLFVFSAC